MAKFKFRLATLMRLREAARDERRLQLAEAYRVDDLLQGQLDEVRGELVGLKDCCREFAGPGTVDVDRLVEAQRYELALRAQHGQIGQQRQAVAEEIERRRQVLVDANRDVRVLQKLRQKQSQRHRLEEGRREVKLLDEVAGRQAGGQAGRQAGGQADREDAP